MTNLYLKLLNMKELYVLEQFRRQQIYFMDFLCKKNNLIEQGAIFLYIMTKYLIIAFLKMIKKKLLYEKNQLLQEVIT